MEPFLNISTYKFAPLGGLVPLRARLLALCREWNLKGTILLSPEGINLFVAGRPSDIEKLLAELRAISGLENLEPKISESAHQPFTRMLVRLKKEIIAFGVEGIDPAKRTSPKLAPAELKRWLDEGRPITLLDTRNEFEIKLGTFKNALSSKIARFRDFPKAVAQLDPKLKEQPIVMFCTGGIRCEKAGPYMEREGFKHVLQLDGGILKYFEECGDDHYEGDCFVFDQRVGVDAQLRETPDTQCFVCLLPLNTAEQEDRRYEEGVSCPHCFRTKADREKDVLDRRHDSIRRLTVPLPGSVPYENFRPLNVPGKYYGQTLVACLAGVLDHLPEAHWRSECERGRFVDKNRNPASPDRQVFPGERYYHRMPIQAEPPVNPEIKIVYEDEAVIVLEKPAPLPVHPGGRFNRHTLKFILDAVYAPEKPRPAHRLDANTSGLMVVARNRHWAGILQPEFSRGEVAKVYLARVQGHPPEDHFTCELPIAEEPSAVGSRAPSENGLAARTRFKVLERAPDGTALLEVVPLTGRTNQIRVHLWQLGFPICGEQLYLRDGKLGNTQTIDPGDPPLALHAKKISFVHPRSGVRMEFETERVV